MIIKSFFNTYRRPLIAIVHLVIICASYLISFLLRFDFKINDYYLLVISKTIFILILVKMGIFFCYRLFSSLLRYASIDDVWRIIKANFFSSIIFILAIIFIYNTYGYPRSIFFIDFVLCTMFTSSLRLAARLFREKFRPITEQSKKKVLIVGAGYAGIIVLKEYRSNPSMNASIVGFIDDNPAKHDRRIQGVKILGDRTKIPDMANRYGVDEIAIAIPSAKGEVIRQILSYCQLPNVKVKIVPSLQKIINGDLEIKPRDIKPEDLLGREAVNIDANEISFCIKNKRVLVTGAGGSIGSELSRQIVRFKPELIILYDHNENDVYFLSMEFKTRYPKIRFKTIIGDIKDIGLLKQTFSYYKPHVVFHSAAHKHVPLMEENPSAAIKNNILGSRNMIYASHHYKAERFILISTDKAVNPTSIMGSTKRMAEMILQAKAKGSQTKFMAVRFGNVIGSAGSAVPLFKRQIEEGGPLTITHEDAKRYFMSVSEAAQLVLQAGAMGRGGEIFILDMGEQIKIIDLAKNLIGLSGLTVDKDIRIKFIGLRPGEKLSEELLLDSERDKATQHNRIYVTQPNNNFDPAAIRRSIKELETLINVKPEKEIAKKLNEILCTFEGKRDRNH